MENKVIPVTIEAARSAQEVFNAITDVAKWWSIDFATAIRNQHFQNKN